MCSWTGCQSVRTLAEARTSCNADHNTWCRGNLEEQFTVLANTLCFFEKANVGYGGRVALFSVCERNFYHNSGHSSLLSPSGTIVKTNDIRICFCSFSLVSVQQRWCRALEMRERERKSCEKPNSAREWDFYNLSPSWPGSMKTLSLNLWLLTHWAFLTTECKCKSLRMWNYRQ